tara:strand:- start:422 stop:661 length:240 start_codon:yes stop_codon:yes gene_type:complete
MSDHFTRSFVAKVVDTERKAGGPNGNPRYLVTFDNGQKMFTPYDCAMAYGITNPEYKTQAHRFGLTKRGTLNGYDEIAE